MNVLPVSITLEEITVIHDAVLARYGGKPGIRADECLEQVHGNAMLAEPAWRE
jgi:hypothetical protein